MVFNVPPKRTVRFLYITSMYTNVSFCGVLSSYCMVCGLHANGENEQICTKTKRNFGNFGIYTVVLENDA